MPEEKHTFEGAIENFKIWAEIRLDRDEAALLVQQCLWCIRADDPVRMTLWNDFHNVVLPAVNERLRTNDWSSTEGETLVLFQIASINIRRGMRNFLPSPFSETLREVDKQALWVWRLLNQGLAMQPNNPYCLAQPWATLFVGGPYASLEFCRRAQKHPVGFAAGLVGYFWRAAHEEQTQEVERVVVGALKRIGSSARKRIPIALQPKRDEGKTASGVAESQLGPMEGAVVDTLLKDFLNERGEKILARSLNGLLNVVPQAVAMDILDKNKSRQENFEKDLELETNVKGQHDAIDKAVIDLLLERHSAEDMAIGNDLIRKISKAHPNESRLVFAVAEGLSLKEISKRAGEEYQTVKRRYHRARLILRNWLET